ncbi:hypothetical protein H257_17001 [Aphanomyces astaci]|uniref:RING-type domain-containing protein n=1 Tax=Aphanomyces astaci TaxID=112090 RepID=W4FGF0_APHAT|nr:hypothetical protein H257_17001 [Aphanomyces astaci]ETV66567.1 hypothetical protein H257_17001 [Aphanomyces astaci]RQM30934.1 hypothetical protein B5M09_007927 [Aphanomyces astaci]|eukprot:XP_009843938.1 hypothetical protein H257_17001 [Aphanomyces astaci]
MDEGDCTICLDPLLHELHALPCGHVFHGRCIHAALRAKKQCPQCRRQVVAQAPIRLFFKASTTTTGDGPSPSKSPSSPSGRRLDDVVATYETKLSLLRKQLHAMNAEHEASKNDLKKWEEYGQKSQAAYKNLASKHATLLRANETLTTDLRTAKQSIVALEATVTRAHADTATVQFLNTNDMNALESDLANPAMVISALKKANRFRMLQYEKVVQKLHVAKEQVNRLTEVAMQGGDAASPRRKKAHKRPHTAGPLPAFDVRQSSMLASFHDVMPAAPGASNAQTVVTQGRQLHWMHREDLKPREIAHPISSRLVLHPRDMHKENHSLHDRSTKPKKAAPAHTNPITNWLR